MAIWNETFTFYVEDMTSEYIFIEVKNENMTGSVLIGRVKLKCSEVTEAGTNNWYSIFDDDGKAAGEVELGLKIVKNSAPPKDVPVTTSAVSFGNPQVAAMPAISRPTMYTYAVAANAVTSAAPVPTAPAPAAVAAPVNQFSAISGFTSVGPTVPGMATPMPQTAGISGFSTPATTGVAYATPSKDHQVSRAAAQPALVAPAQVIEPTTVSHVTGFSTASPASITAVRAAPVATQAQAVSPQPSAPPAAPEVAAAVATTAVQPSTSSAPITTGQPPAQALPQVQTAVQGLPQVAYGQPPSLHTIPGAMQYGQPAMQYGQQPVGVQYASAAPVQYGAPPAAGGGVYYAQSVTQQPYGTAQPVYATAQPYGAAQPMYGAPVMVPQGQVYGAPAPHMGVMPTQYYGQAAYGGVPPASVQPIQTSNPYVNTYLGHAAPTAAPAPTHAPGALPPGWEERRTPDGKVFYVDHNSKSTSWTRPVF
jgi:hypothetical protein